MDEYDFGDWANFGNDIPWESFGDNTDWSKILGPDWANIIGQQPENGSFVGPDGTDPNGFNPGDYRDLENVDQSGGIWQQLSRALGLPRSGGQNGNDTGMGDALAGLLPLLGIGLGGLQANRATNQASQEMQAAAGKANDQITGILGGAQAGYKPYQDAGAGALAKMSGQAPSNIASQFGGVSQNFKPLGSGRSLSSMVRR